MKNKKGFIKRLRQGVVNLLVIALIISHISPMEAIVYASEGSFDGEKVEVELQIQESESESQVDLENRTEEKEEVKEEQTVVEGMEEGTEEQTRENEAEEEQTIENETEEGIEEQTTEIETKEETEEQTTEKEMEEETEEQTMKIETEEGTEEQAAEKETEEETTEAQTEEMTSEVQVELTLEEKVINMVTNGVLITVSGMLPQDATLQVEVTPIEQQVKQDIVQISDMVETIADFETMKLLYSYDISVLHQGGEYEPYENGETLEVRFTHMNRSVLSDLDEIEVFHISEQNGLEEMEVTELSDYEVVIRTNEFSQYIVIGQVEHQHQTYWEFQYQESAHNFMAPAKGIYKIDLYGAQGANYGSYVGGLGGKVAVTIELEKGQNISILTGGQNGFQGGVQGTVSNGGGATTLLINGEIIAMAGGGGGAGIGCDGGNGGEHTQVSELQLVSENASETAGGGGGYQTGANGYVKYHEHMGNAQQGGGCYTQTSYIYHSHERNGCEYKVTRCGATDYIGLGWWPQVVGEQDCEHVMCRKCGAEYWGPRVGGAPFDRSQRCTKIIKEEWSCGKTENSIDTVEFALGCNKEETFVDSVVMSLGGSNFYQSEVCKSVATAVGANAGDGKASITLTEIDAATIAYYENATQLLTSVSVEKGTIATYPVTVTPQKEADSKYAYMFIGWDDMATREIETLQGQETVKNAVLQDRSYIAVYSKTPKSYTITFQHENADVFGTQQVVAQYGVSLPEISIPQKNNYIFAGYYTGENGSGSRIYREDGIGEYISDFEQDTTLYAYWITPLEIIQHPVDVTVQAGYQFAVMETEAILTHMSGYGLTYQWYICNQNQGGSGKAIEGAVGTRFMIPMGYQVGVYNIYCEITATSAYNGQKISKKTQVVQFVVEKGVLLPNQFALKAEKVIYDGKAHTAEIALNVQSDIQVYYSTTPMTKENYRTKGTRIPLSYSEAGEYPIYVYLTGSDYQDCIGMVTLTIQKATPTMYLPNRNVAYNKQQQGIGSARVYGVNQMILNSEVKYMYYTDEECTKLTSQENGAVYEGGEPSKIGTYYVQASVIETKNYVAVTLKQPAMFNIIATKSKFNVSGYHGMYDGKPHGLQIEMENEDATTFWFSDKMELNKENYHTEGTKELYAYSDPGKYTVYYMAVTKITGWIYDYTMGSATVVIEKSFQSNGDSSGNGSGDGEEQGGNTSPSQNQNGIDKPIDDEMIPDSEIPLLPQLPDESEEEDSDKDETIDKKNPTSNLTLVKKENDTEMELVEEAENDFTDVVTLGEEPMQENVLLMLMDSVDKLTPQEVEMLQEYLNELYPSMQEEETIDGDLDKGKKVKMTGMLALVLGILFGMGLMFAIYPQVHLFIMRRCLIKGVCADRAKNMQLYLETTSGVQKIEKRKNGTFVIARLKKGETYLLKGTIKNGKTMVLMKIQLQKWNIHCELTEVAGLQMQVKERRGGLKIQIQ